MAHLWKDIQIINTSQQNNTTNLNTVKMRTKQKTTVKEKRFKRFVMWYGATKKGTFNEEGD